MSERIIRGLLLAGVGVLIIAGTVSTFFKAQSSQNAAELVRDNSLAACERGNALRSAIYQNSLSDGRTRKAALPQYTDEVRAAIRREAQKNFATARALVEASAPVAAKPGSVVQDCQAAYPAP